MLGEPLPKSRYWLEQTATKRVSREVSHLWILTISKKIFRSGGMALSEWTRSVRAVRDTLVADYSVPGVNTTRRVVYRPPIAVSLSLRVPSVSYFK